jgi:hypothetical protein
LLKIHNSGSLLIVTSDDSSDSIWYEARLFIRQDDESLINVTNLEYRDKCRDKIIQGETTNGLEVQIIAVDYTTNFFKTKYVGLWSLELPKINQISLPCSYRADKSQDMLEKDITEMSMQYLLPIAGFLANISSIPDRAKKLMFDTPLLPLEIEDYNRGKNPEEQFTGFKDETDNYHPFLRLYIPRMGGFFSSMLNSSETDPTKNYISLLPMRSVALASGQ